jgi:hypothetical protein
MDDASIGLVVDVIGNASSFDMVQLLTVDLPTMVQAPIGLARRFKQFEALATGDASADSPVIQGEWTISTWVRILDETPASTIFALGGDLISSAQDQNFQVWFYIDSNENPVVIWEAGAVPVTITHVFTTYTLPVNRWKHFVLRKRFDNPNYVVDLFVNGELVETSPPLVNCDGGNSSNVKWVVGAVEAAGSLGNSLDGDVASLHVYDEVLTVDQIKADFRRGQMLDSFTHVDVRVEIEDGDGDRRDLTDLDGVDFVDEVDITEAVDQAVQTAKVTLLREQMDLSIAKLRTDTKLNLGDVDDRLDYTALVDLNRDVEIFLARVPLGVRASGVDWQSRFFGRVDSVDWSGENVTVSCRDRGGILVDTFIEEEVLNSTIIAGEPPEKQPSYGSLVGQPLQSLLQDILDDNDNDPGNDTVAGLVLRTGSYDPITLAVEGTPNWLLLPYRQRREPVLTALRTLAQQIGWECNFAFQQGANPDLDEWRLVLRDVDRQRVDSDMLLTEREVESVTSLGLDIKNIRTVHRIIYPSSESADPGKPTVTGYTVEHLWSGQDGQGRRLPAFLEIQNDAAVLLYGRRFMELGEASTSQIDTQSEALRMLLAIDNDISSPDLEKVAQTDCLFEVELSDVIRFEVIRELYTVIQRLAVVGITHSIGSQAVSTLSLRGKPAIGFKRWLSLESRPGMGRPGIADPRLALTDSETGPLLRVVRNIVDQTAYQSGGKYLAILNQDFQFWTAGVRNPPDGWKLEAGTFGTDVSEEGTTTLTGGHAVEFVGSAGILVSKEIPIQGDVTQPLSFEIAWQVVAGAGNTPNLVVRWLDAALVALGSTPLTPGAPGSPAAPNFGAYDPTLVGSWFFSRVDGIQSPFANARYMALEISTSGGTILVDRVTGYRTSRATRAGKDSTQGIGGWGVATGGSGSSYNQALSVLSSVPAFATPYDRGSQWADDRTSGFPNQGNNFGTREAGTYEVRALLVPFASAPGSIDYEWELVRNGTYNAGGVRASGTVIASQRQTKTFVAGGGGGVAGADLFEAEVELADYAGTPGGGGDRLTLDLIVHTVGPQMILNTGISTLPTFLSIKQRGLD